MKHLFITPLLISFVLPVWAQHANVSSKQGAVKGTLIESATSKPLQFGHLVVINPADSSVAGGGITGQNGTFNITGLPEGKLILKASYLGFQTLDTVFIVTARRPAVELNNIPLYAATHQLNAVNITADRPAIQVKGDTVSFNPNLYKTDPEATSGDLIDKIPALQTDGKGNITSQGKPITKVLVDGKPFYEGNSKDALKMIPASMLDRIDVMNDPDQEYDASNPDKPRVLNLVIKKDKKRGHHINTDASAGNRGQVSGSFKGNIISGEKMFAVRGDGGKGVQQSYNYSASPFFRNYVNKKFSYRIGTRYNYSTNENYGNSRSQNFFGDTSYYVNQSNSSQGNTRGYSAEGGFEYNPNDKIRLRFWQTVAANKNNGSSYNEYTDTNSSDSLLAIGSRQNTFESQSPSLSSNLNLIYRFSRPGRRIETNLSYNRSNYDVLSTIYAIRDNLKTIHQDTTNQHNDQHNTGRSTNFRINYITPVFSDKSTLNIGYNFAYGDNLNDYVANKYRHGIYRFDSLLSNQYRNHNYNNNFSLDYSQLVQQLRYWVGAGYQEVLTKGVNYLKDSAYNTSRYSLYPRGGVKYEFTKHINLQLDYNGSLQPPSFGQLQPTINNTNPQHIYMGNPNLKPAFSNNFNLRFNHYSVKTMNTLSLLMSYHLQEDQIQSINTYDTATGVVTTQPQNVPTNYQLDGNLDYTYYLNQKSSVNFHSSYSYNSFIQRYNQRDYSSSIDATTGNISIQQSMEGNLRINDGVKFYLSFNDWLILGGGTDLAYATFTKGVTIKGGTPAPTSDRYYTVTGWLNAEAYIPLDFKLGVYGNYNRQSSTNERALDGYDLITFNTAITKWFFQKKAAVTFKVNDLTNSIAQRNSLVSTNFIKDSPFAHTTRFYTISFSYTVNKFGKGRGRAVEKVERALRQANDQQPGSGNDRQRSGSGGGGRHGGSGGGRH